jgi:hypothetical protein
MATTTKRAMEFKRMSGQDRKGPSNKNLGPRRKSQPMQGSRVQGVISKNLKGPGL